MTQGTHLDQRHTCIPNKCYSRSHKAWFYVDTMAPNPAPSWTHPLGPPPTSPTPTSTSTSAPIATPAPTGPQNPDTRPLPPGWVSEYDSAYVPLPYPICFSYV